MHLAESQAFQAFVHELDPLSNKLIPDRYAAVQTELTDQIKQAEDVSITTDMWTSSNNQAFMGVTVHWLYGMHNKSYSATSSSKSYSQVYQQWDFCSRNRLAAGHGANVKKAMNSLPIAKRHPCFAHLAAVREQYAGKLWSHRASKIDCQIMQHCRALQVQSACQHRVGRSTAATWPSVA